MTLDQLCLDHTDGLPTHVVASVGQEGQEQDEDAISGNLRITFDSGHGQLQVGERVGQDQLHFEEEPLSVSTGSQLDTVLPFKH